LAVLIGFTSNISTIRLIIKKFQRPEKMPALFFPLILQYKACQQEQLLFEKQQSATLKLFLPALCQPYPA
jgi:hypothetical protein